MNTDRISLDVYATTRSHKLGHTYDECNEQGAPGLHSEDNESFLDDILLKGCAMEEKDETTGDRGCRKFVVDHIRNCEIVLRKLEDVHLTLSGEKSMYDKKRYW